MHFKYVEDTYSTLFYITDLISYRIHQMFRWDCFHNRTTPNQKPYKMIKKILQNKFNSGTSEFSLGICSSKVKSTKFGKFPYEYQKHLLFIFQDSLVIAGLYIILYKSKDSSNYLYISKVDSTGLIRPREMQRSVFEKFIPGVLECFYCKNLRICVISSPNPEYLFPKSSLNKNKNFLNGKKLILWWKHILSNLEGKKYCHVPNCEKNNLHDDGNWNKGYVFDDKENALGTIPVFEDDPKSSILLRSDMAKSCNVKSFFKLLSISQEFKDADIGIFCVEIESSSEMNDWELSSSMFDKVEQMLNLTDGETKKLFFNDISVGLKSSEILKNSMEIIHIKFDVSQTPKPKTLFIPPSANILLPRKRKIIDQ